MSTQQYKLACAYLSERYPQGVPTRTEAVREASRYLPASQIKWGSYSPNYLWWVNGDECYNYLTRLDPASPDLDPGA